jgi:glycine cleavage system aminomethyltransferase T
MLDRGIGLAYVDSERAAPDTNVTVDLRGRPRAAHIVKKPIYKREE